jgi:multidrug transporter EmrE-like cation transporter
MNPGTLALVATSVLASATAQVLFKLGVSTPQVRAALQSGPLSITAVQALAQSPLVLAGLAGYALSTLLWLGALTRLELSIAYPCVGLGIALTTFAGVALLGEPLTAIKITASLLIVGGIGLLAFSR